MKAISIGSWAYSIGPYQSCPVPWDEVVAGVAALGFDGLELGGFKPHPNPEELPTTSQRAAIVEQMAAAGLRFSGLAADLWDQHLVDTDDATAYLAAFAKNVAFCTDLGIAGIRVDTVQPPTILDGMDEAVARRRVVAAWREAAAIAAEAGVYVAWEFEPGFVFNKPSDIERIVDEVGRDNFGVMFDTCHAHLVAAVGSRQPGRREVLPGGALELAQRLRGKINHLHLIDSDGTLHDDETSTHAPFGDGVLDFDALLPELNLNRLAHDWWTIDLCFWPDAWSVTARCKAACDALVARHGQ